MASFGGYSLIGAALLAVGLIATALAQPPAPAAAPPADLTAEERTRAEQVILSDRRVRELVGSGQPRIIATPVEPDKAEAEAFLEGRSGAAPPRRIAVVVFDVRANRAARALVALPENRVVSVQRLAATDVPFGRPPRCRRCPRPLRNPRFRKCRAGAVRGAVDAAAERGPE
jgi:hypothetical protein